MDIQTIILVGDSAGACLCASVASLAALRGFRIPDAIVPIYPTFCQDFTLFFPSALLSLDEELLSNLVMTFFGKLYKNQGDALNDPIMSPLYAS
jgi:acetyl esterase/lipase